MLLAALWGGLYAAPLLGQPTSQTVNAGTMINRSLRGSGIAMATANPVDQQWHQARTAIPLRR